MSRFYDKWLIDAILHLSKQIYNVEQKVDILLENHPDIDLSQEDATVRDLIKTVGEAFGKLPRPKPETTNPKGQ